MGRTGEIYNFKLGNQVKYAGNKSARMVIGAMIVKYKFGLSYEETIQVIREPPYMQHPCVLIELTDKHVYVLNHIST